MELIDKEKVVAEINELKKKARDLYGCSQNVLKAIDTLEVKEVNLKEEINSWIEDNTCNGYCSADIRETAEYFYELGLKAKEDKEL